MAVAAVAVQGMARRARAALPVRGQGEVLVGVKRGLLLVGAFVVQRVGLGFVRVLAGIAFVPLAVAGVRQPGVDAAACRAWRLALLW
jgi:hypothetical protein